jgi:large subunit ribosomal protein L35
MPKMKRHKGLAKRMKVSARGKLRYNKSGAGHLMSGMNAARRRRARKHVSLNNPTLVARIKRYLLA